MTAQLFEVIVDELDLKMMIVFDGPSSTIPRVVAGEYHFMVDGADAGRVRANEWFVSSGGRPKRRIEVSMRIDGAVRGHEAALWQYLSASERLPEVSLVSSSAAYIVQPTTVGPWHVVVAGSAPGGALKNALTCCVACGIRTTAPMAARILDGSTEVRTIVYLEPSLEDLALIVGCAATGEALVVRPPS